MSIVSLFPDTKSGNTGQEDFEREVAARFGLVPNFFRSAPDAPFVMRELWLFAKSAYLDAPIPTLFKERLFVYLSRFCEVRYCITRHVGFLLGLGRSAGDPSAQPMTISQVVRLLQRPVPTAGSMAAALARLEAIAEPIEWPSPETSHDDDLLTSATVLFLQPARADRAKRALRVALGGEKFELLIGLLTFIRSAHYWTLMLIIANPAARPQPDRQCSVPNQDGSSRRLASRRALAGSCQRCPFFDSRARIRPTARRAFGRMEHPARAGWLSLRRGRETAGARGKSISPMTAVGHFRPSQPVLPTGAHFRFGLKAIQLRRGSEMTINNTRFSGQERRIAVVPHFRFTPSSRRTSGHR
jgi:hypothetical protein